MNLTPNARRDGMRSGDGPHGRPAVRPLPLGSWIVPIASLVAGAMLGLGCRAEGPILPLTIGPLTLREAVEGKRAAAVLERMHGKKVSPRQSRIGAYSGDEGEATLYLSTYRGEPEAQRTLGDMDRLIGRGSPTFGHHQTIEIAGHPVSFCLGEGQAHYYFRHGQTIYWLAVDIPIAAPTAERLLRTVMGRELDSPELL